MKKIYNSKWFPRIFYLKPDGGKDSGVTGYFLIEWKVLFSIGILHFKEGTREAFHNHAFNALTWWLKGRVTEIRMSEECSKCGYPFNSADHSQNCINHLQKESVIERDFFPSVIPKYTSKDNFHKVRAHRDSIAITFRGPWKDTWKEFKNNSYITLTHGRKIVEL